MTDKWGRRLFTAGGVVLVFLGLLHSISLFENTTPANDTERQLLDLMAHYRFNLMGSARSLAELMRGFSISFTVASLGLGMLDLMMSRERGELLKRVALIQTIWLGALLAVSLRYFFAAPTMCLSAALLCFAAAWLKLPAKER